MTSSLLSSLITIFTLLAAAVAGAQVMTPATAPTSMPVTPPSQAECETVRLDQKPELGFSQIPAWEQQDTTLCYAFAATVLVDSYRVQHGLENPLTSFTSPLVLAAQSVTYSLSQDHISNFWAGWIEHSLEVAARDGTCRAGWIGSGIGPDSVSSAVAHLREFHFRHYKQPDDATATSVAADLRAYLLANGGLPAEIPSDDEIKTWLKLRQDLFLATLLESLCHPRSVGPLPKPTTIDRSAGSTGGAPLWYHLTQSLRGDRPTAVQFCSDIVTNPKFELDFHGVCSRHYAVAVGQEVRDGKCKILLRDSNCGHYKFQPGQDECVAGQHWVDRAKLFSTAYTLTWF